MKVRIGVNWYLTQPEDNGDGEQRHHMDSPSWECLDQELLDKLKEFQSPQSRTLRRFEDSGILREDTVFCRAYVEPKSSRSNWHDSASKDLAAADLIFLDPDNGFQVRSMSSRNQAKYALYEEALHYARLGKIVISIQFARQCDPVFRARSIRQTLTQKFPHSATIPVVRCRVAPNVLFLVLAPEDRAVQITNTLNSFAARSPVHKGDQRRIEVIL